MTDESKRKGTLRHSSAPPGEVPAAAHKEEAREGGIEAGSGDPLGQAPTREPYAARSGQEPEESGPPDQLTRPGAADRKGGKRRG